MPQKLTNDSQEFSFRQLAKARMSSVNSKADLDARSSKNNQSGDFLSPERNRQPFDSSSFAFQANQTPMQAYLANPMC